MKKDEPIPIVIPVYNPPEQFMPFMRSLTQSTTAPIIIVNDGSSDIYAALFQSITEFKNVTLLTHDANQGKGAALKTAMHHVLKNIPSSHGIITADADGQHVSVDIIACETLARTKTNELLIGTRVSRSHMPLKSRTGNAITRTALKFLHGTHVGDTQSGLRYIPMTLIRHCIESHFNKYDFELDMLIRAVYASVPITEFPIETIYLNKNRASHYKTVRDSTYVASVFLHHIKRRLTGDLRR